MRRFRTLWCGSRTFGRLLLRCDDLSEKSASLDPGPALWDSAADRKTARTASPRPPQRRATYTPDRPSTPRGTARTTLPMCAGVRTPRHPERTANMLSGSTPEKSPTSSPEEPFGLYEGIDVGCGSGLILRRARRAAFQDVAVRITDFRASALALRRSLREERPSRYPGPALWDSADDNVHSGSTVHSQGDSADDVADVRRSPYAKAPGANRKQLSGSTPDRRLRAQGALRLIRRN